MSFLQNKHALGARSALWTSPERHGNALWSRGAETRMQWPPFHWERPRPPVPHCDTQSHLSSCRLTGGWRWRRDNRNVRLHSSHSGSGCENQLYRQKTKNNTLRLKNMSHTQCVASRQETELCDRETVQSGLPPKQKASHDNKVVITELKKSPTPLKSLTILRVGENYSKKRMCFGEMRSSNQILSQLKTTTSGFLRWKWK